jgi:RNA polymerase sigma factor (sigma-70 family)
MFSIAYRMLGSVAEAEDVVQDAFLRMFKSETDGTVIDSPDAFATTITTRLAIDALRSARVRREQYVGQWLPEPLVVSDDEPARRIETDETISTAFLVLLETLAPVERAVFLLREVFGYGYDEIAGIVEKSESNCRQILARAKRAIAERRPRFDADRAHQAELSKRFLAAANEGNMDALHQLLADVISLASHGRQYQHIQAGVLLAPGLVHLYRCRFLKITESRRRDNLTRIPLLVLCIPLFKEVDELIAGEEFLVAMNETRHIFRVLLKIAVTALFVRNHASNCQKVA